MADYTLGDTGVLTAMFRDMTGANVDVSGILLSLTRPGGSAVSYSSTSAPAITHVGTGQYAFNFTADTVGTWAYRWSDTSGDTSAGAFTVAMNSVGTGGISGAGGLLNLFNPAGNPTDPLFGSSSAPMPIGITLALPPVYLFAYNGRTVFNVGENVSFEVVLTDSNGGLVPVPSALVVSLLDSGGASLGILSAVDYDSNNTAAVSQILSGLLALTIPGVFMVMWQPVLIDSAGGTGTQRPVYRVMISVTG